MKQVINVVQYECLSSHFQGASERDRFSVVRKSSANYSKILHRQTDSPGSESQQAEAPESVVLQIYCAKGWE
jgi:hypothetical protein